MSSSISRSLRALLREPLLHFVVLGVAIFAVDHGLSSDREDPHTIVVGPAVDEELRAIFLSGRAREPTAAELEVLRQRWIDNEVLYREGLALRLEKGDTALRERVIFKALNVIESNLRVPSADEAELRRYFEAQRAEYDIPARYDFSEAVLRGEASEQTARTFADALNGGTAADVESALRVFSGRPRDTVAASFGDDFADELDRLPLAHWEVLDSREGVRVVRLEARTPGAQAQYEAVRSAVRQDWIDQKAQALRTAAVREIEKKYRIERQGAGS